MELVQRNSSPRCVPRSQQLCRSGEDAEEADLRLYNKCGGGWSMKSNVRSIFADSVWWAASWGRSRSREQQRRRWRRRGGGGQQLPLKSASEVERERLPLVDYLRVVIQPLYSKVLRCLLWVAHRMFGNILCILNIA